MCERLQNGQGGNGFTPPPSSESKKIKHDSSNQETRRRFEELADAEDGAGDGGPRHSVSG